MPNTRKMREAKGLDETLCDSFAVGARQACGRKIVQWLFDEKLGGISDAAVANQLLIHRSTVGRWRKDGALDLERLLVLMVEFDFDFHALKRPRNENLAIGGYVACVAQVLRGMRITAEEFCCIWSIRRYKREWMRLRRMAQRADVSEELEALSHTIACTADHLFSGYISDVPDCDYSKAIRTRPGVRYRKHEELAAVYSRWGEACDNCILAVYRYAWLTEE